MSSSTFGITHTSVHDHYFSHFDSWSTRSSPTVDTIAEIISEEAARMAGKLALENVSASAITLNSDAYKACARILRLQVAIRLVRIIPGADSQLAQRWDDEVAQWYVDLDEGGASFLGDGATATGTSDPDGPTSHLGFGLTTDDPADMSSTVPFLRKDDAL